MDHFESLRPLKFVAISAASSGDNTVLAANADRAYRVLGLQLSGSGTVTAQMKDGASGAVMAAAYLTAGGQFILPTNLNAYWNQGTKNTAVILNLSGATTVQGNLVYQEV